MFVYTIKDGDGDTSTTTLTINLTDSGIVAPNDSDVTVNENALDTTALPDGSDLAVGTVTGSLPGSAAETDATNQLNGSGGTAPLTYALVSGGNAATAGTFGTIQVNADGSYVYTLTKPFDTSPDADNGANTEVAESFQYRVTDAAGNSATGTITVNIVDDVPTAHADTNSVVEGGIVSGNVLTDGIADVFGADGATTTVPAGGVVGFAAGSDTSSPVLTGIGTPIAGSFGTLTLNADGTYSYDGNPNVVPPAGATDVFVYTIKDGDGDTSTTTLTINLTDSGIVAPNDSDVTVNENALDTTALPDGSDLAVGTVTGSLPGSAAETDATNQLNGSGGTAPLTYALVSGGNAATAGTFGTIQVNARRQLCLHADQAVRHQPGRRQRRQHGGGGELPVQGDRRRRQQRDRHDHGQHRRRRADGACGQRQCDRGRAADGCGVTGGTVERRCRRRDGFAAGGGVVGVRAAGSDLTPDVTTGVGTPIAGLHGTLHLNADGSYTYQSTANNITADTTDVFVYTIKDGDGDLSTTTLTINLANVTLCGDRHRRAVNEAALTGDRQPTAASNSEGSQPGSIDGDRSRRQPAPDRAACALTSAGDRRHAATAGAWHDPGRRDGTYTYTLTTPFDTTPDSRQRRRRPSRTRTASATR